MGSQEHFVSVAQNTITNAYKLLAAADELAQTGECDPAEIYNEARSLEERIATFIARIQRRRDILNLSVAFYTHTKELSSWFEELKPELQSSEIADTVDGAEELLSQFGQQKEATIDACISTISEGENLLDQLRTMGSTDDKNGP